MDRLDTGEVEEELASLLVFQSAFLEAVCFDLHAISKGYRASPRECAARGTKIDGSPSR